MVESWRIELPLFRHFKMFVWTYDIIQVFILKYLTIRQSLTMFCNNLLQNKISKSYSNIAYIYVIVPYNKKQKNFYAYNFLTNIVQQSVPNLFLLLI